ncbi:PAAR domain-containing protein [Caballeronia sp.]|uniref:PAAR domain-containing protein n=1 Tax=Caballeronia sp. TaxID=1931223 RepID=UPI003C6ECA12
MYRFYIKEGDNTSSGATIVQGIQHTWFAGPRLAFVGAALYCPVCKSTGEIVASGPRRPGLWMGKQRALSGDYGMCKCDPIPRVIASQSTHSESYDNDELGRSGYTSAGKPLDRHHDERFKLRDRRTGTPLANVPYRVKNNSSVVATGVTDSMGHAARVRTEGQANLLFEIAYSR